MNICIKPINLFLIFIAIILLVLAVVVMFSNYEYTRPVISHELPFDEVYYMGSTCSRTCDEDGSNCHDTTEEECGKIDDLTITDDGVKVMPDGIPDCEWNSGDIGSHWCTNKFKLQDSLN